MEMKRIQLDVSSDIFDKVISFLKILPKQKIRIKTDNISNSKKPKKETLVEFFKNSPLAGIDIERSKEPYSNRIEF